MEGREVLVRLQGTGSLARRRQAAFSGGSDGKEPACNAGDLGSIPGSGRSHGKGSGNPLQQSCLENAVDTGAPRATVHRVTEPDRTERLTHTFRGGALGGAGL